ncbi:MAG: discoidin domain-containing protein [Clostridia bacterium]|nr:discoidin domain-containing protein [Clostridia bacterium]
MFVGLFLSTPCFASEIDAKLFGVVNGSALEAVAALKNMSEEAASVKIYSAVMKGDILQSVTTERITLPAAMLDEQNYDISIPFDKAGGEAVRMFVLDYDITPLAAPLSSSDCAERSYLGAKLPLTGANVWASSEAESWNPCENTADGSLSTVWSASNVSPDSPQSLVYVLDGEHLITRVGIAFGMGNERTHYYRVQTSTDGIEYTDLTGTLQAKRTNDIQYTDIAPIHASHIKYTVLGRDSMEPAWIRVSEIEAFGISLRESATISYKAPLSSSPNEEGWVIAAADDGIFGGFEPRLGTDLGAEFAPSPQDEAQSLRLYDYCTNYSNTASGKAAVIAVSATAEPEPQNSALMAADGDLSTKWTASNVGESSPQSITATLAGSVKIDRLGIAFGLGSSRTHIFSVDISSDGENYTNVLDHTSSVNSDAIVYYDIEPTLGRYIRLTVYGREDVDFGWIQLSEIEAFYTNDLLTGGTGGVFASLTRPELDSDVGHKISFNLYIPLLEDDSQAIGGIALTDGPINSDMHSAVQLRFLHSGGKVKIGALSSNVFGEGSIDELFESSFTPGCSWSFVLDVSPSARQVEITVSDGEVSETQLLYYSYSNADGSIRTTWRGTISDHIIFHTGADSKCELYISNLTIAHKSDSEFKHVRASHSLVRLESPRLAGDPEMSEAYFGRYVYHNGAGKAINIESGIDRQNTLFVERSGLIDASGISFELVNLPGYFIAYSQGGFIAQKFENTANFKSAATFYLSYAQTAGYYEGSSASYSFYQDRSWNLFDSTVNRKTGALVLSDNKTAFYVRDENWTIPDAANVSLSGNYYRLTQAGTEKSVAVEGGSSENSAKIALADFAYSDTQRWAFMAHGNHYYTVTNKSSGKSLDLPAASKNAGVGLTQYTTNNNANQTVKAIKNSDGTYSFQLKHSELYLTVKDNFLVQDVFTGEDSQRFTVSFVAKNLDKAMGAAAELFALRGENKATNAKLQWNSVSGATAYEILRSENGGDYESVAKLSGGCTYDDYDLNLDSSYKYTVKAYKQNSLIASEETEELVTFILPGNLLTYSNLTASSLQRPNSLCVDGVYYRFSSQSRTDGGSGFGRLMMTTSTDGVNYGNSTEVLNIQDILTHPTNTEFSDCKFESSNFIYNPKTNKFYWWAHFEKASGYSAARVSVAYATPGQPFIYGGSFRPMGDDARDMNIFIDDDNRAYLIAAINGNADLALYRLTEDWTNVEKRLLIVNDNNWRELPNILKKDGIYYLFSSGTAGWYPTQSMYNVATNIAGPWSGLRRVGNRSTFSAQSGSVSYLRRGLANSPLMITYRWKSHWSDAVPRSNSNRLLPISASNGYAFFDFYDEVLYNVEDSLLVPVQSGKLLSQRQPAEAPSNSSSAGLVNDGDYQTSWSAENEWPTSWSVDLGQVYSLSEIQISWYTKIGSEAYYNYTVEVSADGIEYRTILDKSSTYSDYGFTADLLSGSGRYVRLNILDAKLRNSSTNTYTPQLYEVKVFGF